MKQTSLNLNLNLKKTRKQVFFEQMDQVVLWSALVDLIAPYYPEGKTGRPPFSLHAMLCIHFMQQRFTLSDPAMEEAFFDTPLLREFAQLDAFARLPDESTILRFRHRLEKPKLAEKILAIVNCILIERGLLLKAGTVVDATLIAAPPSTKNKDKTRDPDMHSSKKGNQWYFGMKAHIGADPDSGLVHTVRAHQGMSVPLPRPTRCCTVRKVSPSLMLATRVSRSALNLENPLDVIANKIEKCKASIRAKVEHPFRVIERQFGFTKVRYRGLKKNTAQLVTLFALSNLWKVRRQLMGSQA